MKKIVSQVKVAGDFVTRDGVVNNEKVLEIAINHIGSKVSVPTLHMHLVALYDYMDVPIHGSFVQTLAQNWGYKNFDFKSRLLGKCTPVSYLYLRKCSHTCISSLSHLRWNSAYASLVSSEMHEHLQ